MEKTLKNTNKKITVEMPRYGIGGGIQRMKKLAEILGEKYNVNIRIQKTSPDLYYSENIFTIPYSIGMPDNTFPQSDVVITYSDNPYLEQLTNLPQVKKTLIYMLSYGMCFERERKNILNPNVVVISSTHRTQKLIEYEGVKCNCVGFGFNPENFYCDYTILRKRYVALLCHGSPDKKYELGVKICDKLCDENLIDGVICFGTAKSFGLYNNPKKIVKKYIDATPEQVREVFCQCSVFIMPSITEGLNLTPVESTLCGCPSVVCDGAFGDIFFDEKTCLVADKNNFEDIYEKSKKLLLYPYYALVFRDNLKKILNDFTWEKTIANIEKLL